MKHIVMLLVGLVALSFAVDIQPVQIDADQLSGGRVTAERLNVEVKYEYQGMSSAATWIDGRDPPWEASIQVPDVYDNDDILVSMAEDATGRVYVCYETINTTGNYAWGLATSTDNGTTWDNRAFYATGLDVRYPEIAITDDGKIYIFGSLEGGSYNDEVIFMESTPGWYNNPDSLDGFYWFGAGVLNYRTFPEAVTYGNNNQLILTNWTYIDQTGPETVMSWLFSWDGGATSWYYWNLNTDGNPDGMTSVGVNYDGANYIAVHSWEENAAGDWTVWCIQDTVDSIAHSMPGWSTTNTNADRYPTVFCSDGYGYIAYQADDGTGNNDIMFNYSTDYGSTWLGSMINLTNDPTDETYARLYGYSTTIGCAYLYGGTSAYYNYSINNGQAGTWLSSPEIASDNNTCNASYHCLGNLYTSTYLHCAWEDTRSSGSDGIEIYAARRTTPIGIEEYDTPDFTLGPLTCGPNPFRDFMQVDYVVKKPMAVNVTIYDVSGKEVTTLINGMHGEDTYSVTWTGTDNAGQLVPAGIYFCTVEAGDFSATKKLVLVR